MRQPTFKQIDQALRELRAKGAGGISLMNVDKRAILVACADAIGLRGSETAKVEQLLVRAIDRRYAEQPVQGEVARLWFGLDDTTRSLDPKQRHKVACARLGTITLSTFETHEANRIYKALTYEILTILNEPANATVDDAVPAAAASQITSSNNQGIQRSWSSRRLIIFVLLLVAVSTAVLVVTIDSGSTPAPTTTSSVSLTAPANFPPITKGNGTETTVAVGHYGSRRIAAKYGIVLAQRYGVIEVRLYPEPISCALWYRGTPSGIYFELSIDANISNFQAVPIGKPLREYFLSWHTSSGNRSVSDGVTLVGDADEDSTVVLTAIDTSPAGFWRGRIRARTSTTANGKQQRFEGTFAAQWCNIAPVL